MSPPQSSGVRPSAANSFNRSLTDLGFGAKFTAEVFHKGEVKHMEMAVSEAPMNYDSAPKYKADALGVTARDITYELREYFQLKEADPGVIISRIEQGSRASTSGIKPYEIITHVNGEPLTNVKDFEKQMKGQTEVRLSIKRMSKTRQVKVTLPANVGTGEK